MPVDCQWIPRPGHLLTAGKSGTFREDGLPESEHSALLATAPPGREQRVCEHYI